MKELLEFIKDFILSIGNEINDNEGKGLLSAFFILIGLILFISPGFILMFFFNIVFIKKVFPFVLLF